MVLSKFILSLKNYLYYAFYINKTTKKSERNKRFKKKILNFLCIIEYLT